MSTRQLLADAFFSSIIPPADNSQPRIVLQALQAGVLLPLAGLSVLLGLEEDSTDYVVELTRAYLKVPGSTSLVPEIHHMSYPEPRPFRAQKENCAEEILRVDHTVLHGTTLQHQDPDDRSVMVTVPWGEYRVQLELAIVGYLDKDAAKVSLRMDYLKVHQISGKHEPSVNPTFGMGLGITQLFKEAQIVAYDLVLRRPHPEKPTLSIVP